MHINLYTFFILLMKLLSPCNLSSINDNNNQHQVPITHMLVNQSTSSTILSTKSINIKWIKKLKNITENDGETVILECQVKSLYPVTFNWYRYNNPLDKSNFIINNNLFLSSIYLKNLKESQAGFYTCEVSNSFQTLTSTGFVRVKSSNIDSIDSNDDLLPSIEFQPEIFSNNEELIEKLKCEIYTGNICKIYLKSKYISVITKNQKDIEKNLIDNMKFLTDKCQEFLLPMICLFVYPICDNNRIFIRSICRKSCYHFQNNTCIKEFFNQQQQTYLNFQVSHNIPTCENLPPSSDDESCIEIDQHRKVSSSSSDTFSIIQRLFSSDSLPIILLSTFILITFICLLTLFMYYCYSNRINKNDLSSYTSTLTPIEKSSHLLHHHNIISSSSSSTNTNLTNTYHRQTLNRNEYKPKQKYFTLNNNSLCEISFRNIYFLQEIGQGEFGQIYIGELIDTKNKCIIKTLQNENVKQDYLREIEIFSHIYHINISCLIGICNQPQNSYSLTIYEYLNNDNLHEYLICQHLKIISLNKFLYISIQIVSGMIYLSEKKFLHKDLSTKNILISENLNIKITNIGCYQEKYHLDYYKIANHFLPVRWMSIESLLSGIYSEMSDVWSFGVLLWEMFSYGIQPYYGKTNPEVIEMIRDRNLLTCPINCPKKFYNLMCLCWKEISEDRPTFNELMKILREFEEKSTIFSSIDDEISSESHIVNYKTLISSNDPIGTESLYVNRNSIRFET